MVEVMENELVDIQQGNSSLTSSQALLISLSVSSAAEDEAGGSHFTGEPSELFMNNDAISQQQNALEDEETEPFSLSESSGTESQEQLFDFMRQNSLQDDEPQMVFSVDPVNEFMMFYYNYGGEIREEIVENSLVMLVTMIEGYELFEGPESQFEEQSHLNNNIAQTQQQFLFNDEAESIFTEENTGARSQYQVQHQNFIQQSSLEYEPSELVFSVDPVNEFIMFHYNLSEEIEEEPID